MLHLELTQVLVLEMLCADEVMHEADFGLGRELAHGAVVVHALAHGLERVAGRDSDDGL